jgi:hypothetical protein
MADEVQVSTPPGGNGFKLDLKQRSLGLTGPIVIPCLCIFLVAGIGWIRSGDFKDNFTAIRAKQDADRAEIQTLIMSQFDQTRSQLRAMEERLNANKANTDEKLEAQNTLLRQQTEEMRRQHEEHADARRKGHAIIIYNQRHPPEEHLTLDLPLPQREPYGPGR